MTGVDEILRDHVLRCVQTTTPRTHALIGSRHFPRRSAAAERSSREIAVAWRGAAIADECGALDSAYGSWGGRPAIRDLRGDCGRGWLPERDRHRRAAEAFLDAIERGEAVGSALRTAGRAIEGAAATAIAAILHAGSVTIASAGDCRAYLVTGGAARVIAREQTLGEKLVALGQLTAVQELAFPHRNVVLAGAGDRRRSGDLSGRGAACVR